MHRNKIIRTAAAIAALIGGSGAAALAATSTSSASAAGTQQPCTVSADAARAVIRKPESLVSFVKKHDYQGNSVSSVLALTLDCNYGNLAGSWGKLGPYLNKGHLHALMKDGTVVWYLRPYHG